MKRKLIAVVAALAVMFNACKKQEIEITPISSLKITNVVVGGSTLQFGTDVTTIAGNSSVAYSLNTGAQQIKLVAKDNNTNVYYDKSSDLTGGRMYSLFLTGTPSAVESVFVKEEKIGLHKDEVFGIRIINLSPGNAAISVNLAGSEIGSLYAGIDYKSITDFKMVSAKSEEGDKTFEFRSVVTGVLITKFTVPAYDMPRFRNVTVVFSGITGSEKILRVNNF